MKKLLLTIGTTLLLTVIFVISAVSVSAATEGITGTCTWKLDGTHLIISGQGVMSNYGYNIDNTTPWGTDITKVTIQDGVTSIGNGAFYNCGSLTSVTIPNSVTSIGDSAFYNCGSLTSISVSENNPNYSSLDGVVFNKQKTTLVLYPAGKSGAYTIPDSVTIIGEGAFYNCSDLSSVTIPDSVTSIEESAFYWCRSLTEITIPNKVKTIGNNAFLYCSNLENITIGSSVVSIGNGAFSNCNLSELVIPDSVTYIGNSFVAPYDTLYKLVLGNGVTEIPDSPAIELVLGDGITEIPNYKFKNNTNLTSITLGKNVTTIGDFAFYNCSNLFYVGMNNALTHIGDEAFVDTGMYRDSKNWINDVMYVGKYAVDANPTLTGACKIQDGTLLITQGAFYDCPTLTEVIIPDSVKGIGRYAFYRCGITELVIPDSVTIIEPEAFEASAALTKVTLPGSVTSIGNQAFKDCVSLTDVYYTGTKEEWEILSVGTENQPLNDAEWHCNFEIPTSTTQSAAPSRTRTIQKIKSIAKIGLSAFNNVSKYVYVVVALFVVFVVVVVVTILRKKSKQNKQS